MEHKVPKELNGATVLDAHQWVLSKLDGQSEYTLMDSNGQPITLSDLGRGTTGSVKILPNGARVNPAASYAFKPSAQPQKHGRQFSSRVVAPDGISPSILQAVEASHGTHAAVHMLSKMLSQRNFSHRLSPKGQQTLEAFVIADPVPVVRSNPSKRQSFDVGLRATNQGLRMARVLGEGTRVLDDTLINEVEHYLNAASGGSGSYISANEQQFKFFLSHVLRPYLIAVQSNQQLLKYLNKTLIPHMNRLIDNGRFKPTALEAQGLSRVKAKLTASTKTELKKAIQKRYDVIVHRLATSPQDFYYGRNEALIAHPGFLLPQLRYMLLPPPAELTGGTRAEMFLFQAGEPPIYGVGGTQGGTRTIVQQLPPNMLKAAKKLQGDNVQWPIARINNRPVDFGDIVSAETVQRALQSGDIGAILTSAGSSIVERINSLKGTKGMLAVREEMKALDELREVVDNLVKFGTRAGDLHEVLIGLGGGGEEEAKSFQYQFEKLPLAAAIELNISGIRPAPIRWPEGLIFAMMQILSENPDHITNLHSRPDNNEMTGFFSPILAGPNLKVRLAGNIPKAVRDKMGSASYDHARTYLGKGVTLNDLIKKNEADNSRWVGASVALHVSQLSDGKTHKAFNYDKDADMFSGKDEIKASEDPTKKTKSKDGRLTKFVHMAQNQGLANFDNQTNETRPKAMSLLNILQQAITRAKEGGFTPTPGEVKFSLHLLMYSIANIGDGSVTAFAPESETLKEIISKALSENDEKETTNRQAMFDNLNNAIRGDNATTDQQALEQLIINTLIGEQVDSLLAGQSPPKLYPVPPPSVLMNPSGPPSQGIAEAIASRSPMSKLRSALDDSLNKEQLRQIKNKIEASKVNLLERSLPQVANPMELVNSMADSLRATFNEAVQQTEDDLKEAKALATANKRIERLLDRSEKYQARSAQIQSYESLIVSINHTAGRLLNHEEEYVNAFTTMMPDDPFQEIPSDVGRHEMYSHPLYQLIQFRDRHNLFMSSIEQTEDGARSALMGIRAFVSNSEELDREQPRLEYLMQLIEFTNALQEAYGDVRPYLDSAIDMMQGDDGDFVSPWLYIAALDIRSNFEMRAAIRRKLRDTSKTALLPMDPLQNERAYTSLETKLVSVITAIFGGLPSTPPISRIVTKMAGRNVDLSAVKAFLDKMLAANIGFESDEESADKRAQFGLEVTFPEEATRRLGRAQLQAQRDEAADRAALIQQGERAAELESERLQEEFFLGTKDEQFSRAMARRLRKRDERAAFMSDADLSNFDYRVQKAAERSRAEKMDPEILTGPYANLEGFEGILARAPQTISSLERGEKYQARTALEAEMAARRELEPAGYEDFTGFGRVLEGAFENNMDPRDLDRIRRSLRRDSRLRLAHSLAIKEAGRLRMREGGARGRETQAYLRTLKREAETMGIQLEKDELTAAMAADELIKNMSTREFKRREAELKNTYGLGTPVKEMSAEEQEWWDAETAIGLAEARLDMAAGGAPSAAQLEYLTNPGVVWYD